jgi:hypothetical protein
MVMKVAACRAIWRLGAGRFGQMKKPISIAPMQKTMARVEAQPGQ